ncbi:MAG: C25 family cysteine peptidase, partial [bacterium]|nr:C25 family cysteine peptidase [bacterium]
PDLWAHEHVFTRGEDIPRLNNRNNLPFVFTASCEIAFFDDPEREGMAEDLLTLPDGGIGVISATRRVYSGPNADLNQKVYDVLFGNRGISICEALYTAKLQRQYIGASVPHRVGNDQAYLYFGDPLMKLGIPEYDLQFDSLPDSIMALSPYTVYGRVVDSNGTTVAGDGELDIRAFDTDRRRKHYVIDTPNPSNPPLDSVEYFVNGPSIFRGSASVSGGQFQFTFIPPLDIAYGGTGAKISGYCSVGSSDGFGIADSLLVSRVVSASNDSAGPSITFSVVDRKDFITGDFIAPGDELQVDLADPIGINLTGGIGHGISLEIDGESDKLEDLTELFQYDLNSYNSGSLVYAISDLEPGLHHFKVKAWDNANNFSTAQFSAEVVASSAMAIRELLNYPNPMADSTRFSYYLTQPVRSFSLEIFTLSGRKIRSFKQVGRRTAGYYDDIVWYGDDFAADRVATGVYIFKAEAIGENGDLATESFGKLVLIN